MAAHKAKQPQPVLTRAGVVTAISVLAALVAHFGGQHAAAVINEYKDWAAGAVLAAGPVVTGWLARRHVTPLSSPRDADGNELAPAGTLTLPDAGVDEAVTAVLSAAEAIFPSAAPTASVAA